MTKNVHINELSTVRVQSSTGFDIFFNIARVFYFFETNIPFYFARNDETSPKRAVYFYI